jgi:hypothetical protein
VSIASISSNPNWLSQLTGQNPPTASAASSKVQDLQNFLSTLMQALHQAGTAGAGAGQANSSPVSASGPLSAYGSQGHHGHGHGGHKHGGGLVATQLESLLQQVSSSNTASSTAAGTVAALQNLLGKLQSPQTAAWPNVGQLLNATA